MIVNYFTKTVIENDGKCKSCKYNVGTNIASTKIWCDNQNRLGYKDKNYSCDDYKFMYGETKTGFGLGCANCNYYINENCTYKKYCQFKK